MIESISRKHCNPIGVLPPLNFSSTNINFFHWKMPKGTMHLDEAVLWYGHGSTVSGFYQLTQSKNITKWPSCKPVKLKGIWECWRETTPSSCSPLCFKKGSNVFKDRKDGLGGAFFQTLVFSISEIIAAIILWMIPFIEGNKISKWHLNSFSYAANNWLRWLSEFMRHFASGWEKLQEWRKFQELVQKGQKQWAGAWLSPGLPWGVESSLHCPPILTGNGSHGYESICPSLLTRF